MTFQEALKDLRELGGFSFNHEITVMTALAEQIEANRLAILELSSAVGDRGQATGDSTEAAKILDAMEVLNHDRA